VACSRPDPDRVLGHWVADSFKLQGLGLPIGPDIEITPRNLRLVASQTDVPLRRILVHGNDATVVTEVGVDVTFTFDDDDTMTTSIPFLGDVRYRRIRATTDAATPPATKALPQTIPSPSPSPAAVIAPMPASIAPPLVPATPEALRPADEVYQRAAELARTNDMDNALRALSDALAQGYADWSRIDSDSRWDAARADVRFQALRARWKHG
jgi:hypothetical protein